MSIAKKISFVASLLAALLLVGSGYAGRELQERALERQVEAQATAVGQLLASVAEAGVRDRGQLAHIADHLAQQGSVEVIFYGADGRAEVPVPEEEEPVTNARARRVIESNRPEGELFRKGGHAAYVYRAPLHLRGKAVGALELRLELQALREGRGFHLGLAIAGGLLLLFALLVGIFSRRAIGRPIGQLMDGMDHVIRGDLSHALPLDRSDEIGRIAYRFNEMTSRLRAAQDEILQSGALKLELEQRLRQSEKLATIGQLSAEIAHEVGTPLNVIGGRARALERKAEQPAEVLKNAKIIADQASRITKIIQQMLDVARARAPRRGSVDLARVLDDALAFLEYQIQRAGIEVQRELPPGLPPVMGDADGLQQVVLNLLVNAIQAMPGGGTLTVRCTLDHRRKSGLDLAPPQRYLQVLVADSGPGIPEETRAQIFEPFYSTKPQGEGTGLGLTVVHGIVKEHDGWVEVETAQPHGAAFRVYLPTEPEAAVEAESSDAETHSAPPHRGETDAAAIERPSGREAAAGSSSSPGRTSQAGS
ncbi:MAG: HAMP domain-containing protein [Deltaproteobacteria bacterium]|nr:HAMP domain-containing protein [Deltaproteobacteria bacterium]